MKNAILAALLLAACAAVSAQQMMPKPEAELKELNFLVGEFDTVDTMHMPDGTTMENKSVASSKWMLMDRYVHMTLTGDMGPLGKYEGLFMITYNEMSKQYEASWFDSMGGESLKGRGQMKDGSLTLITDPMKTEGGDITFRLDYKKVNDTTYNFKLDLKMGDTDWQPQLSSVYKKKPARVW